jgi:hypothetical protein
MTETKLKYLRRSFQQNSYEKIENYFMKLLHKSCASNSKRRTGEFDNIGVNFFGVVYSDSFNVVDLSTL